MSAAGMLVVRRRAPEGTYFKDPIPAGAVYTVAGTAYMVIVAFVFFIAFESYGGAKADAEDEATATLAMFHAVRGGGPPAPPPPGRPRRKQGPSAPRNALSFKGRSLATRKRSSPRGGPR